VRARRISLLAVALTGLLAATAAALQEGSRQTSEYTLTETRAGHPTAEDFVFDYVNPDDPEAKPPAVRHVVTVLPRGGRYDASVPASCTATDAELTAMGGAACPEDSAIGGGVVTVDSGTPGPARIVTADVEFFNNAEDPDGEFIYVNTIRDTGARTIIRADVRKRRTITNAGMLPGFPPDGGAIDTVDLHVDDVRRTVDGEERAYITTPPSCRPKGTWLPRVKFTYADGVSQVVRTEVPCTGGEAAG